MNRCLAFLCALLLSTLAVASACTAQPTDLVRFTLESQRGNHSELQASFRKDRAARGDSSWSTGVAPSRLLGLDMTAFLAGGMRPVRFAMVQEAGRLDCSGQGGAGRASGECTFTPDAQFANFLQQHGIARPNRDEAFGLMALDVRRELVEALAAAHYPTPKIEDLMSLTALEVDRGYIESMARAGYGPPSLDTLVEFKALDITPTYVAGFQQLGYGGLPPETLVELKALDITPEFIRAVKRDPRDVPPVKDLVNLKIFQDER